MSNFRNFDRDTGLSCRLRWTSGFPRGIWRGLWRKSSMLSVSAMHRVWVWP